MVTVEPIGERTKLGEGPHWDEREQVLYFVDMLKGTVNKYDPATKTQTSVTVGSVGCHVSLVVPVEGKLDQFVVSMKRGLVLMKWDGKTKKPTKMDALCVVHDKDGERDNKFNDGKVDPTGRFWAGTMGSRSQENPTKGCLFSFSKDWKPTVHLTGISLSNGMAWSPDMKTMYYIDSHDKNVKAFDFNPETGVLSNGRVAFDFKSNKNFDDCGPDGMTIDTEGMIWVACVGGGQVIRVDPTTGQMLSTVIVPSPMTTSVAFGGPNLDEMYITSGTMRMTEEDLKKHLYAGYTFRVTGVGAKGFHAKRVQLNQ